MRASDKTIGVIAAIGLCAAFWGAVQAGDVTTDNLSVYVRLEAGPLSESASTNGLQLYYSCSTSNSSYVLDDGGNNYTGTVSGASWTSNALMGGAYAFDGSDDNIASSLPSIGGTGITLSAWVNVDSYYGSVYRYGVIGQSGGGNGYQMLRLGGNGTSGEKDLVDFAFYDGASYPELAGSTHLATGTWHHIAATYDGAHMRVYVNGVQDNAAAQSGSMTTGQTFVLGYDASIRYFDGQIDEARVYNRALSSNEVYDLYLDRPAGRARFTEGLHYCKPLGDIPTGSYTNSP